MDPKNFGEWQSPFIPDTNLQFAWDSTSLGLLKTCPRKYQLSMIEGWRKKDESVHLTFGIHFHKALELYDVVKAYGGNHEDGVDGALVYLLEATWIRTEEAPDGAPWSPDNSPKKNRETLIRSVLWYLEEYKDDAAKTVILADGKPAVELSFRFDSGVQHNGVSFLLSGHMDRVVDFGGNNFVMDRKTSGSTIGSYYFNQYSPDNQMTLYTLAGKLVYDMPIQGVIIDAAQIAVGFTSFARGITMRSEAQLEEYLTGFEHWTKVAALYANEGFWPMNETACGNYGGCPFREVCSKDPSVRPNYLKTDFEKRFWNPLETR